VFLALMDHVPPPPAHQQNEAGSAADAIERHTAERR
jgi:hypothetical protein